MYTNADSLMNKFIEFKERVKMDNCLVIGITEVKPKNPLSRDTIKKLRKNIMHGSVTWKRRMKNTMQSTVMLETKSVL